MKMNRSVLNELSAALYEQFAEADRLEAAIKRNFPACRSQFCAGREVFGYGD
jgi:hypothetical protein